MKRIPRIETHLPSILAWMAVAALGFVGCNTHDTHETGTEAEYQAEKREYWITTELKPVWDAVPGGISMMGADSIDPKRRYLHNVLRYVLTDSNWKPLPAPSWQGLSGPLIHAYVGDSVIVHFRNEEKADIPVSLHTHNFYYDEANEGAWRKDLPQGWPDGAVAGGAVSPGKQFTYRWVAKERSAGAGPYHSHSFRPADEVERGLSGIVVVDPPPGSADYIRFDTTIALIFKTYQTLKIEVDSSADTGMVRDSTSRAGTICEAPLIPWNGGCHPKDHVPEDQWPENRKMGDTTSTGPELNTINGMSFGNLPTLQFKKGQKVRFVVIAMNADGSQNHTVHFHGEMLRELSKPTYYGDVFDLPSAMAQQLEMKAENIGRWMIHCHVEHHASEMMASYEIVNQLTQGGNHANH